MTDLLRALALFPLFVAAFVVAFAAGLVALAFDIDLTYVENVPAWVGQPLPHRFEESPAGDPLEVRAIARSEVSHA